MGFSVTAAHVIFGIALLAAFSVATGAYWQNQTHVEESRRAAAERAIESAHTEITITGWLWDGGTTTLSFTIGNQGTTVLDYTRFTYLIDGTITFASQSAGYPKLNGANPPGSDLLLPGDELDCSFPLASEPSSLQIASEHGSLARHEVG